MKYNLKPTTQFRKDLKLCKKRGYDLKLLTEVLKLLEKGKKLPEKYLDHADAFHSCMELKEINIPSSVTVIGFRSFEGCTALTDIVIPDSVTEIGGHAFWGVQFDEITIPKSVSTIGEGAFTNVSGKTGGTVRVPQELLNSLGMYEDGFQEEYAYGRTVVVY